jgi:hypothetical protein
MRKEGESDGQKREGEEEDKPWLIDREDDFGRRRVSHRQKEREASGNSNSKI